VETKDGFIVRLKPMAISDRRIQSSVQYEIRKKMKDVVDGAAASHTFSELTSLVLTSDRDKMLVSSILKECKTIYPLKRVDIRKMEVLSMPENADDTPMDSAAPVPEEEPKVVEEAPAEEAPVEEPKAQEESAPEPAEKLEE
jgi:small subunit ribosomal protein S3Ae